MRLNNRFSVVLALGVVGLCGLVAVAAEKPTPEYQKAMKDLGAVAQAMGKPGASEDFPAVTKSVESAKAAYGVVEKYWQAKGVDDALKAAQAGSKAAADMGVAANLTSAEGVQAAFKDMTDTCRTCHTAHREKMEDGTFTIK